MAKGLNDISLTNPDGTEAGNNFSVVLKQTGATA